VELERALFIDKSRMDDWPGQRGRLLRLLERIALAVEEPVNRLVGASQLNPFYYTGPITVFLLLVVAISGLYLIFYGTSFGFDASYQAVARLEAQLIGRTIRAIHRYAAGAAVVTSLIHAFRLLFMDRFRGPYWLAWVSGVGMTLLLWLEGVTGYWLVWDQRAQLITIRFTHFLRQHTWLAASFVRGLIRAEAVGRDWVFMAILFLAHLLLFAIIALFFWLHILRLRRPKLLPELYWLYGLVVVLLAVSAAAPAGMLPQADFSLLPGSIRLDPIFLFFLPSGSVTSRGWLWGGLGAAVVLAVALPWLPFRRRTPPVTLDQSLCTGCTTCATDCPYKAITMMPRNDGKPHKLVAVLNPDLCVSCGVCLGSCKDYAFSLGALSFETLQETVRARLSLARERDPAAKVMVVFTCERHAAHRVHPHLNRKSVSEDNGHSAVEVIAVPCVAAVHPDLVAWTLDAGGTEVRVVGCPPDDCARREGNLWTEERLSRRRLPRLKRAYENAPIATAWLPPNRFSQALYDNTTRLPSMPHAAESGGESSRPPHPETGQMFPRLSWRHFIPAFALLGLVLALQIWLTNVPAQPYTADQAVVQVLLPDPAEPFGFWAHRSPDGLAGWPTRLVLQVDDHLLFEKRYDPASLATGTSHPLFEEFPITPGEHHLRLRFEGGERIAYLTLFDQTVAVDPGQILVLGCYYPGCSRLRKCLRNSDGNQTQNQYVPGILCSL